MVATKRKRPGQEYSEDDKLKHQATKALTKEAKRVKTFLLQQAIRKSKAAAEKKGEKPKKAVEADGEHGEEEKQEEEEEEEEEAPSPADGDASGGLAASSQEVLLIKSLQPLAVVKICLRQLGLAHTGVDGEAEVEVGGSDQLRKLVGQVVGHKRITAVLEELQDRVTLRRREKLAESEGRSLPGQGQGRAARIKGKGRKAAAAESNRQQGWGGKGRSDSSRRAQSAAGTVGSAFVSLSGESPADEEPSRNYYNKDIANASANASPKPKRWKPDASAAGKSSSSTKASSRANTEPGWAGADRAAGWGRGGGRSKNGGRGGRGGRGAGGRQADNKSDPGRQQEGRGGGAGRGRGPGARAGGAGGGRGGGGRGNSAGGGGGGGNSNREDSRAGTVGGEALHGSWAAKRALKEKEASATAAFSGKRITFGDDDD